MEPGRRAVVGVSGVVTAHRLWEEGRVERLPGRLVTDGFVSTVDLPVGASIATVGFVRAMPGVWVVSSGFGVTALSKFLVVGDGVQDDGIDIYQRDYVGSAMRGDGSAAWHVFWIERGDLR